MNPSPTLAANDQDVIATYQRLADLHQGMLAAARARDWQTFEQLGQSCAKEIDKIQSIGSLPVQSPTHRREKIDLLERILSDDRRIREIVVPWMGEVERLLHPKGRRFTAPNLFQRNTSGWGQA